MHEQDVIKILKEDLDFSEISIEKLKLFAKSLILANKKKILFQRTPKATSGTDIFLIQPS